MSKSELNCNIMSEADAHPSAETLAPRASEPWSASEELKVDGNARSRDWSSSGCKISTAHVRGHSVAHTPHRTRGDPTIRSLTTAKKSKAQQTPDMSRCDTGKSSYCCPSTTTYHRFVGGTSEFRTQREKVRDIKCFIFMIFVFERWGFFGFFPT